MSNDVISAELIRKNELTKLVADVRANHPVFRERPGITMVILQYLGKENKN